MTTMQQTFTSRDFTAINDDLVKFVQVTRPDLYTDFTTASLGTLIREWIAYAGDNANFAVDAASLEALLSTCRRLNSGYAHAQSLGYTPRQRTAATVTVASTSLPSGITSFGGTIAKGQTIKIGSSLTFELLADVVIPAGAVDVSFSLVEGVAYTETFPRPARAGTTYTLSRSAVADGSWSVQSSDYFERTTTFEQVSDITAGHYATVDAEPRVPLPVYQVGITDKMRLTFTFGDNTSGVIPTAPITISYRTCAGSQGNIAAGALSGVVQATYIDTTNPGNPRTVTAPIPVTNYVLTPEASTRTLVSAETVGAYGALNPVTFQLAHTPLAAGGVYITVTGQNNIGSVAGVAVFQDDGAGHLRVVSNNIPSVVFDTANCGVVYSAGQVRIAVVAGTLVSPTASVVADYYYYPTLAARTTVASGAGTGGADEESLAELKVNVPAYLASSDRMVTLTDYRKLLQRMSIVGLAHVDREAHAYIGNSLRVFTWKRESSTLTTRSADGASASVPYTRYAKVSDADRLAIQAYVQAHSFVSVSHNIYAPEMAWLDVYLGSVQYDRRQDKETIRAAIAAAVVNVFETGTGFTIRPSAVIAAVLSVSGVRAASVERITQGRRATAIQEAVVPVGTSTDFTCTVQHHLITPGTLTVYLGVGASTITLQDNGHGAFNPTNTVNSPLVSTSIDYLAGTFQIVLSSPLPVNTSIIATYADVTYDYRKTQTTTIDSQTQGDYWPPPGTTQGIPIVATPSSSQYDGSPVSSSTQPPYSTGSVLTYRVLTDLHILPVISAPHYYNEVYFYNGEILYDSEDVLDSDVVAFNLRNLIFDLVGVA